MDRGVPVPLRVGAPGRDFFLDLFVFDYPVLLEVDQEDLAGLEPAQSLDSVRRDVEQTDLGPQHDQAVGRLQPSAGPKAVAVEGCPDHPPIREGDCCGAVPGLHEAGMERVEALELVGEVIPVPVCLGNHHHRRVGQGPSGEEEQLEDVVEGGGIRAVGSDHRDHFLQVFPEQLTGELRFASSHPVDVSPEGVDLPVVGYQPEGMGKWPAREGVCREPRVDEGHRGLESLVDQVGKEVRDLVGDQHPLVDDRPRGEG